MLQRDRIIKCLKRGWKSPIDALNEAGTMKLATRVSELRREGHNIKDKWNKDHTFKLYRYVGKTA
jgi:hypothetical protein